MLLESKSVIERHNKTGRPLNKWSRSVQSEYYDLKEGKFSYNYKRFKVVNDILAEFKAKKPRTTVKKLEIMGEILLWLCYHPNRVLNVSSRNPHFKTTKRIAEDLEVFNIVEIYQGFSTDVDGRRVSVPMGLKIGPAFREMFK